MQVCVAERDLGFEISERIQEASVRPERPSAKARFRALSLAPRFIAGGTEGLFSMNRFNGFSRAMETVKTVEAPSKRPRIPWMNPGVNETSDPLAWRERGCRRLHRIAPFRTRYQRRRREKAGRNGVSPGLLHSSLNARPLIAARPRSAADTACRAACACCPRRRPACR
jgi:hypothetical protein